MDIKDCLHLYLGCECVIKNYSEGKDYETTLYTELFGYAKVGRLFIKLRPLSDMTEEESIVLGYSRPNDWLIDHNEFGIHSANTFLYLLKQGFDLFGLIDAGLAIDKTKTHHQ